MDFTKIIDLKYIFVSNPAPLNLLQRNVLIAVFGLLIIIAIIAVLWGRQKKLDIIARKITSKISLYSFTMGFIGWLFFFMRQYRVYFFSRRFWLLLWSLGALVWVFFLLKYIIKKAPTESRQLKERREFEKYLPKKK